MMISISVMVANSNRQDDTGQSWIIWMDQKIKLPKDVFFVSANQHALSHQLWSSWPFKYVWWHNESWNFRYMLSTINIHDLSMCTYSPYGKFATTLHCQMHKIMSPLTSMNNKSLRWCMVMLAGWIGVMDFSPKLPVRWTFRMSWAWSLDPFLSV